MGIFKELSGQDFTEVMVEEISSVVDQSLDANLADVPPVCGIWHNGL